MSGAMAAMERLNKSRQKAGAIVLSMEDRANLNAYLADRMANGWTAEDRKEYLDACKAEFDNPTEAGGLDAAIAFWREKVAEIRRAA